MKDSTIKYIVYEIARQAKMRPVYDDKTPLLKKRTSVNLTDVNVMIAFATVLKGSGLNARLAADGETVMIGVADTSTARSSVDIENGSVVGRVTDSATGKGVEGATISISGTKAIVTSREDGNFRLPNVVPGDVMFVVKIFGYRSITRPLKVAPGRATMVNVVLTPVATTLSGVVTTATGVQRKVEVGNDITTIHVDSILRTMPVTTLSSLLATRVPGLYAVPVSGEPGAPTRIRIRGLSSINASNDPLVIIDGVQIYAKQIEPPQVSTDGLSSIENTKRNFPIELSPLDQIDPQTIDKVEVLKGPSAVALYGSNAANGVIVITTKRGVSGRNQWGSTVTLGTESMPGRWPMNYYAFGHSLINEADVIQCTQYERRPTSTGCIVDSLAVYQMLNQQATTIFGRGNTESYSVNMTGGSGAITYAVTGSMRRVLGLVKLPDADVAIVRASGLALPDDIRRPQANETQNGSANVTMELGRSTLSWTTMLARQATRGTPVRNALLQATQAAPTLDVVGPDGMVVSPGAWILDSLPDFRKRESSRGLQALQTVTFRSIIGPRISTEVTAGVDMSSQYSKSLLGRGECWRVSNRCDNRGEYFTDHGSVGASNLNFRASVPIRMGRFFNVQTSIGANYVRESERHVLVRAYGLPTGATSANGADTTAGLEQTSDRSTAGVYLGTTLGIANRFYFPLEIRKDAGSALGSSVAPVFPRLSFSYLLSDESWFQRLPLADVASSIRLRLAYGQAGKQPSAGAAVRTYLQETATIDGTSGDVVRLAGLGNTMLKPERSREIESGADIDLLQDRMSIGLTWYRKSTKDLLFNQKVPLSVYGGGSIQTNIGDVLNNGWDVTVGVTPIQRANLVWRSDVSFSRQRNKVVRLGSNGVNRVQPCSAAGASCIKEGYPLYGQWTTALMGYDDIDGDGRVTSDEVLLSDSLVFVGAPYPNFSTQIHQTVTFLHAITLGAVFSYQDGLSRVMIGPPTRLSHEYNDPAASLAEQANLLFGGGKYQSVSTLQFGSFSLGWIVPRGLTRSIAQGRTLRLSLQGTNLGVWTKSSVDPNRGGMGGEESKGVLSLPTPRVWALSLGIN